MREPYTRLQQLTSGYLSADPLDHTATITFLMHAEAMYDPFGDATVESAQQVVRIWRPPWLKGIDWDEATPEGSLA